MAVLLRAGGGAETIDPEGENGTLTLDQMQQAVGGYIEVVTPIGDKKHLYIVDEEGKLKGKPINEAATNLSGLYPHDVLVGDVLLIDRNEIE